MNATDELRDYIKEQQWCAKGMLTAIADRIDAAHEKAIASVMNDALYHANDKDMADLGWVRMPKDADGEPIHIGDVMGHRIFPDAKYTVIGIGENAFFTRDASGELYKHIASLYPHYKQPTVEDTLREFADKWLRTAEGSENEDAVVAKYAKRLRLAGSDAE